MSEIQMTRSQEKAFNNLKVFLDDPTSNVFILKGYAGTGKTTLMKLFIKELQKKELNYALLASTGRAAKILSNATGHRTRTVHSEIYKFSDLNQDLDKVAKNREETKVDATGQLYLNFELTPRDDEDDGCPHYYIIDEASMISDARDTHSMQAVFGSGRLLKDLFDYDCRGKFIFIGDICQLPPVSQAISPALDATYLQQEYGLKVYESELTQIVRQEQGNDITLSAQQMRKLFYHPQPWKWAKFPLRGYRNIHVLSSQTELINKYIQFVKEKGFNAATLLCCSNKQSNETTRLLRPVFGHHTPYLESGDLLLVTQNNLISGLMNGDLVVVEEVRTMERRAGLTFLHVKVKELFTGQSYTQLLISDVLYGNLTNITQAQQKELFIDFYYRMKAKGIKQKSLLFNQQMMEDPYLNALRTVYGYSLTCHKSQGGEWDYVFLDIARSVPGMQKPYVYQWMYTAMTRARKELYVVQDFWVM